MFVRKRTRTRLGQGGYDPWKGRAIPYYQVVASWSLHPGLAAAIREREAWITHRKRTLARCEQALAEGKPWQAFPRQVRNPHEYVQQQIVELRDDIEKNLGELARLRAAHAALG